MIRADQIPDKVVKAAVRGYELYIYDNVSSEGMRLAIAVALAAWPGKCVTLGNDEYPRKLEPHDALILPIPQRENTHE